MKKSVSLSVLAIFCGLAVMQVFTLSSCKSTKKTTTTTAVTIPEHPTYTANVKPIIDAACGTKCHSAVKKAHDIDLSNYEMVKDACIKNKLLASIKHESGVKAMPRMAPKLSNESIAIIEKWINEGFAQ
ncbi:MAG: hypothetical protein JSS90_00350 [Bacteroidetes bacterium]|jgi:cytochrome c553|nr:hypothetical protein [Bacteroidota bacterium]